MHHSHPHTHAHAQLHMHMHKRAHSLNTHNAHAPCTQAEALQEQLLSKQVQIEEGAAELERTRQQHVEVQVCARGALCCHQDSALRCVP